jgi:hypothetical protein
VLSHNIQKSRRDILVRHDCLGHAIDVTDAFFGIGDIKRAPKPNFKNWPTNSGTLGSICTVLLPSRTLNISLLSMGGNTWKDWVKNLVLQPDWKDKSIKIADVTNAILQTKPLHGHTAQASSGEKVHFLSRGRDGGL